MRLLDELIGAPHANEGGSGLRQGVLELLTNRGSGGLGGLIGAFEGAGLGSVIRSWIGTGANQPISPDRLQGALGEERVQQLSASTGMPAEQLLPLLAQYLPTIVDRLTPGGHIPQQLQPDAAPAPDGPEAA